MLTAGDLDVTSALAWAARVTGPVTAVQELVGGWTSTMLALTSDGGDDVVLRLMTREPWRTHGEALTNRESQIQAMLASTPVPAPRSRALDAKGAHHDRGCTCGLKPPVSAGDPTQTLAQAW